MNDQLKDGDDDMYWILVTEPRALVQLQLRMLVFFPEEDGGGIKESMKQKHHLPSNKCAADSTSDKKF